MFSLILPGRPCLTNIVAIEPPTKYAFSFPSQPSFSHIVVFLLPGNSLPPDVAAGVYIQFPGSPDFKFLGAIANEKQSAIFKVSIPTQPLLSGNVTLGISIEPISSIQAQMAGLEQQLASGEMALVKASPNTKVLAKRIIQNAFNFLASFSGDVGGNEVVPLKSFQDWWRKFEARVDNDPGFLERDEQN